MTRRRTVVPIILEGTSDAGCLVDVLNLLTRDDPDLHELCVSGDLTLYRINPLGFPNLTRLEPHGAVAAVVNHHMKRDLTFTAGDIAAVMQVMDLDGVETSCVSGLMFFAIT